MSPLVRISLPLLLAASAVQAQTLMHIAGNRGASVETYADALSTSGGLTLSLGFQVDYLMVGGGGGGGGSGNDSTAWGGGGGGAGGLLAGTTVLAMSNTATDNRFNVSVGAGGAGGPRNGNVALQVGGNGGSTTFNGLTALGGGGGGAYKITGAVGGSGGGGGGRGTGDNLRTAGGAGTSGQGFAGGASRDDNSNGRVAGGGGGGAGGAGGDGGTNISVAGNGGLGLASSITGSSVFYAGGGGGGAWDSNDSSEVAGAGGSGIGGNGSTSGNASAGAAHTGSGGGGVGSQGAGGAGGSGIIIIRYQSATSGIGAGGTEVAGSGTASGYTVHSFTHNGTTGVAQFDLASAAPAALGSTVSSDITGAGSLTLASVGRVIYTGTAAHTGGTNVNAGTLQLGNGSSGGSLGGAVAVASGATLEYNRSADGELESLSGAGSLAKKASGSLTLGDASSFSGAVSVQAGRIRLGASGALGSGLVTLSGGSLSSDGSSARTVSNNLSITAVTTTLGDALDNGALELSGTATLGAGQDRYLSVLSDVTVTGELTGSAGLLKNGAGTLTLSGVTSYTGTTRVNAGTLRILNTHNNALLDIVSGAVEVGDGGTTGQLGTGDVQIGVGATLVLDRSDSYTVANNLRNWTSAANHGTLVKRGAGTLTLTGTGAAFSNSAAFAGLIRVEQGEVVYNATGRNGSAAIIAEVAAGTHFTLVDNSFPAGTGSYYSRVLNTSGAGSVTLTGTAGRNLWGASQLAHTGGTVIDGAALKLNNPNTGFATGSSLVIRGGGALSNQLALSLGSVLIESGYISGGSLHATSLEVRGGNVFTRLSDTTSLLKTSEGVTQLESLNPTRTGATRIEGGILWITQASVLGAGNVEVAGGTLRLHLGLEAAPPKLKLASLLLEGGSVVNAPNLGSELDASLLDLRSGTLAVRLGGAGAITKTTAGTVLLSASNTKFSGSVTVSDGTLQLGTVTSLGSASVLLEGGTIELAGTTRVGYFEQTGGTVTGGTLVSSQILTESGTLDAVIADGSGFSAGILKRTAGLTEVTAANTFTGVVSVQNGTLRLAGNGAFASAARLATRQGATFDLNGKSQTLDGIDGDGAIALGNNGSLTVSSFSNSTYAGVISGDGGLVKSGAGTLTLTGANTYTGITDVTAGTFIVNGSISSGSSLEIASGATLGGSGTILAGTTISGTHSPGNSPGLQTFGPTLAYNPGAEILWELAAQTEFDADRGVYFDGIDVNGDLVINGPVNVLLAFALDGSTVDWTDAFWASGRSWKLFDVSDETSGFEFLSIATAGALDSEGQSLDTVRSGAGFSLSQRSGDIFIDYVAPAPIPEPSTYGLLLGGLALAGAALRRRRKA